MSVDALPRGANNGVGLVFGYTDDRNYYLLRWQDYGSAYTSSSTYQDFELLKISNGSTTVLARKKAHSLPDAFEITLDVSEAKAAKQYLKSGLHRFWKKYENKFSEDDPEPMKSGDFMQEDIYACEQLQKSLRSPY